MLFNSIEYLIFFPIVFLLYWFLQRKLSIQNLLLLVSSYVFYAWWDWRFLSLIIYSSLLDYVVGLKIHASNKPNARRNWLLLSLVSNLGLLAVFKYNNFFIDSFADLMHNFGWEIDSVSLNIILPVGISFYTFQTLSYTIDIYRNQFKPTKNIVSFFTYVSLFPQLVAGPIERASNLLPQIESRRKFDIDLFKEGIVQITAGLFRKIVIADNLGVYVDAIYGNPEMHNSSSLIIATVFYSFQIYYDFAGYSDIAIGSAKLLGFRFNQNFNFPYFSSSITMFWRRWHISLSSWLRDYLYISLGGNRKGIRITYRNLMLTMLLGGLWHGSSWNFVIWGGIHGLALSLEKYLLSFKRSWSIKWMGYIYVFPVVLLSWVFFRATDLNSSIQIIKTIFQFRFGMPFIGNINVFLAGLMMLGLGFFFDLFIFISGKSLEELGKWFSMKGVILFTTIVVMMIILFYSTASNFIYFQF